MLPQRILVCICLLITMSCHVRETQPISTQPAQPAVAEPPPLTPAAAPDLHDRLFIVGDFNGDDQPDTLFESYISALTHRETSKVLDSADFYHNIDLIVNNQPITRLYASVAGLDTVVITEEAQQAGFDYLINLGDLNADGCDEFGYMIRWADASNLNSFCIASYCGGRYQRLHSFQVNESANFETDNLFTGGSLIQVITPKTIAYKFYSDSATVETGTYTFGPNASHD